MANAKASKIFNAFASRFATFVRIDFSCKQLDDEKPHEFAHSLREQTQTLCETITSRSPGGAVEVQLWPTLLTTCEADAVISRQAGQDRGTYLLGLEGNVDRESVTATLRSWQTDVRTGTLFMDYIPTPSLSALLIRNEDLGRLVVDAWIYPQLGDEPIMIFTPSHIARTDSGIKDAATRDSTTARAGSSVAEATARRSPSPGTKKLTPATAILNRLKWDDAFDSTDFVVVYEDRHEGLMENAVDAWTTETTEETFIPMHRIRAVKKKSTGMVVWHREERIDLISGSAR